MIRLYGKNRQHVAQGRPCYWTDVKGWRKQRKRITGQAPLVVNVASKSKLEDFRNLSPMRMGPVPCYREKGKLITAVSVEVAWQYSKIYSHVLTPAGKLVDISRRFLTQDAQGRPVPTEAWFAWRNAAFTHPGFHHTHPDFVKSKPPLPAAWPRSRENHEPSTAPGSDREIVRNGPLPLLALPGQGEFLIRRINLGRFPTRNIPASIFAVRVFLRTAASGLSDLRHEHLLEAEGLFGP